MKIFLQTTLAVLISAGSLMAQADPFGETDTLYLDQLTVGAGDEFVINVNLWSDEELGGIQIPLAYPTDKLEFREIVFAGGRIDYVGTKPVLVDDTLGEILVGAIVFLEDYIAAGDGPLFGIKFKLKEGLPPGEVITIDSTYIAPASLVLANADAVNIYPVFRAGTVTVGELNRPPSFVPIPDHYVAEGESLYIAVAVTDPDGDQVSIANPVHPHSSQFVDHGDGTGRLAWRPDFVGPLSSDLSPFEFVFWASDGEASSHLKATVHVINVNRPPQVSAPGIVEAEAGDSVGIVVTGTDPDFESVVWQVSGLPTGAAFDYANPGLISWASQYADSGAYQITVTATDPHGLADTAGISIDLMPVTLFALRVDTVTSFSGRIADVEIFLKNKLPVAEFDLMINFDAALLTPIEVVNEETRSEHFEFFQYQLNPGAIQGDVRIIGRADIAGEPVGDPIAEGDGPICRVPVHVSPNLSYVGSQVPIRFVKRFSTNNTLVGGDGQPVASDQVNLFDGYVLIASPGKVLIGDINLNGVQFEISDAVYFNNFYISPGLYPLNDQQVLNSDINQDGLAPSVADLVLMIKIIAGEIEPPAAKALPAAGTATIALARQQTGLYVTIDSPADLGGVYFTLRGPDVDRTGPVNLTEMKLETSVRQEELSCLLISFMQKTISSGTATVIKLSDDPFLDIALERADAADAAGRVLNIDIRKDAILPTSFALHQNYPNPFNPSTEIRFDLETPGRVTLAVYNILGQEVIRLADGDYPAGSHAVVWDGVDMGGRTVASGIYLYRLAVGNHAATRKMVLMK